MTTRVFFEQVNNEIIQKNIKEIRILGYTDIRASSAYNKKLGLKRALAVRNKTLKNSALSAKQIKVISYGKMHPLANGVDEDSHALNRRVDILFKGEY